MAKNKIKIMREIIIYIEKKEKGATVFTLGHGGTSTKFPSS